jgi:hypothetical protein
MKNQFPQFLEINGVLEEKIDSTLRARLVVSKVACHFCLLQWSLAGWLAILD